MQKSILSSKAEGKSQEAETTVTPPLPQSFHTTTSRYGEALRPLELAAIARSRSPSLIKESTDGHVEPTGQQENKIDDSR